MKITWQEREIENKALRVLAAVIVLFGVMVFLPVAIVLSLPVHALLRICGRRGFAKKGEGDGIIYEVNFDGFRKAART